MPNCAISFVFRPKRISCVPTDYPVQHLKTTEIASTRNAAFPLALMRTQLKATQNHLNKSETRVKPLKVCSRVDVVDAQTPQPIDKF